VDGLFALAMLELDLGHPEEALEALGKLEPAGRMAHDESAAVRRLLRLDPVALAPHLTERSERFLHLKADALRQLGRSAEAEECQAELTRTHWRSAELSACLREQKRSPQDGELMGRIGRLYLDLGFGRDAEPWLLKAVDRNPGDTRAHEALAGYYASRNTPDTARLAEHHRQRARGGK
jgi:Tfp pilus assembly protein PilF